MLLNLSNHPSGQWPENQLKVAVSQYGRVEDIPFPAVAPDAETEEIVDLATTLKNKCIESIKSSNDKNNAVHIMGEMTLAFTIVALLHKEGCQCIASTTTRTTKITAAGEKISQFGFVKFRKYPNLNTD
jgi:hypothetical protein